MIVESLVPSDVEMQPVIDFTSVVVTLMIVTSTPSPPKGVYMWMDSST